MLIRLHKNARTTPAIRREFQDSTLPTRELAERYSWSRQTVSKWRGRSSTENASPRPPRLHTRLTPAQEAVVVELRRTLLLPLDDLLAITHEGLDHRLVRLVALVSRSPYVQKARAPRGCRFGSNDDRRPHEFISTTVSRSGLDRCLRRYGVANLQALKPQPMDPEARAIKLFKDYESGFVHIDVKYLPRMPDEDRAPSLFAAIDWATRWVYVEIRPEKTAHNAASFLERIIAKAPFNIAKVLTDNCKEFTDRFCATGGT